MASSKRDQEQTIFNCPICLDLFDTPKMLPQCGHSFCLRCLRLTVSGREITCPECRTKTLLGSEGLEGLKTNITIQRATDYMRESSAKKQQSEGELEELCTHALLLRSPRICQHCKAAFCDSCLIRHLERLKIEINWLGCNIEERLEKAKQNLDGTVERVKTAIEDQTRHVEEEVIATSEAFEQSALESIRESRKRSLEKVREVADGRLAKLRRIIEDAADANTSSIGEAVTKVNKTSLLFASAEEFAEVHKKVANLDSLVTTLEELRSDQFVDEIKFETNEDLTAIQSQLDKVQTGEIKATSVCDRAKASTQQTRLHAMAKAGNLETVREILSRKGLPDVCKKFIVEHKDITDHGQTPLLQAAEHGHVDVVKLLVLDYNANLQARSLREKMMAIHLAAEKGHLEVVKFLAEHSPEMVEARAKYKKTALFIAAVNNHIEVVRFLITEKHADVDVHATWCKDTPLIAACDAGHLEMVQLLVQKGASLYAKRDYNDDELLAIHVAAEQDHCDIVKYFISLKAELAVIQSTLKVTPLHAAAREGAMRVVTYLVDEAAVLVDSRDDYGRTPMMDAAQNNHLEVVKFLIEKGADISAQSYEKDDKVLAIHVAAQYGHRLVVDYLLSVKPDLINVQNGNGETPLDVAQEESTESTIALIKSRGGLIANGF